MAVWRTKVLPCVGFAYENNGEHVFCFPSQHLCAQPLVWIGRTLSSYRNTRSGCVTARGGGIAVRNEWQGWQTGDKMPVRTDEDGLKP